MNDAGVRPFSIRALLEDRARYLVPMYQRNYAWGEGEITQLLQDVLDYQQKLVSGKGPQTYYRHPGGVCPGRWQFRGNRWPAALYYPLSAGQLAQTSRDRFGGYELVSDHQPRF
jgi:hypothetical protein